MTASILNLFAEYLWEKSSRIDTEAIRKAENCERDYIAVAAAGARKNREKWNGMLLLASAGPCTLKGYTRQVDASTAAMINGFNAHTLELDDGHRFGMLHPGAPVISAISAVSDLMNIPRENYLKGIVMGYEAACRIAMSIQPSHKKKGYHATGTCGTIGAAVGTAFAMNQSLDQLRRTMTCAAGSAAGLLEMQEQQSELKPYNAGRAAMDGLMAAQMGCTEFLLPDDILGGERGFLSRFSDSFEYEKLVLDTDFFEIERIYVKSYASCRHSHTAVEAAIKIHESHPNLEIESVIVRTYGLAVKSHDHTTIRGIASAKLSTPYAVAAALMYGRADLSVFEPLDERIMALAAKIKVVEDEGLTAESPRKRVAIVIVKAKDGMEITQRIDYAKGEPENPLSDEELEEKIHLLSEYMS